MAATTQNRNLADFEAVISFSVAYYSRIRNENLILPKTQIKMRIQY